jgi:hypothetical protein
MTHYPVTWKANHESSLLKDMSPDELDLFETDMQDAIDGVIEDWEGK